jgi:hypothetical protein
MAAAGLPPAFRSAATSPNKEKEAGGAILIICVRRPFLRSGRRMGKPFDENRSRNCRRQSQHGPLGLGSRPSSPRVSSLANRQVTRQPSLHLCIRAAERRSDLDGQHSGRYHDSKEKGAGLYWGSKEKQLFRRFARGIVAALFQSGAPRRDYCAVQPRSAAYKRLFARIFRSDPLSLVE